MPERADLTLAFRDTSDFFQMFTGRLNLLGALLTGRLRPRGNLRLFLRFSSLFSVDAT
jgi:putative sterol carrier protein